MFEQPDRKLDGRTSYTRTPYAAAGRGAMIQVVTPIARDPQVEAARVPPQSIEAEQSVLGGLLLDNSAWDRIADLITEQDFYRSDHRTIFQHIGALIEHGKPADTLTVGESLERSGKLGEIG